MLTTSPLRRIVSPSSPNIAGSSTRGRPGSAASTEPVEASDRVERSPSPARTRDAALQPPTPRRQGPNDTAAPAPPPVTGDLQDAVSTLQTVWATNTGARADISAAMASVTARLHHPDPAVRLEAARAVAAGAASSNQKRRAGNYDGGRASLAHCTAPLFAQLTRETEAAVEAMLLRALVAVGTKPKHVARPSGDDFARVFAALERSLHVDGGNLHVARDCLLILACANRPRETGSTPHADAAVALVSERIGPALEARLAAGDLQGAVSFMRVVGALGGDRDKTYTDTELTFIRDLSASLKTALRPHWPQLKGEVGPAELAAAKACLAVLREAGDAGRDFTAGLMVLLGKVMARGAMLTDARPLDSLALELVRTLVALALPKSDERMPLMLGRHDFHLSVRRDDTGERPVVVLRTPTRSFYPQL
jgi:hypothetical protein